MIYHSKSDRDIGKKEKKFNKAGVSGNTLCLRSVPKRKCILYNKYINISTFNIQTKYIKSKTVITQLT